MGIATTHFSALGRIYRPTFDRYRDYEESGSLFVVTARDQDRLAGFAIMYVFCSMHDQSLAAQEDFFYLLPEYRRGWNAVHLLSAVERECARRGVTEVHMTVENGNPAGHILSARGYAAEARCYRKSLVRADSPSTAEAVDESLPVS